MSRYHSYLNNAEEILSRYHGDEPFASFLKKYFSANKKYGSRDRKQISHLCYCYFRMGKMCIGLPVKERILSGLFLCSGEPDEILQQLKPGWHEKVSLTANEKLSLVSCKDVTGNIFRSAGQLSDDIDKDAFIISHLAQPDVFLRLRPGKEEMVIEKLKNAGIKFEAVSNSCLALPQSSKIDSVIELNKEAVVQDYSSQRVGELMLLMIDGSPLTVWDCCAASGGKSIMLHDLYPGIQLTVSDIRESILVNLKKRFREAGITKYKSIVTDLTHPAVRPGSTFDLIIADIPCTGSGTWGRSPENLFYFEEKRIDEYVSLQKKILSTVIPRLRPGGYLLYITCSVFKKENEGAINFIQENSGLRVIKMEVLKGYSKKADTMFAALLQQPL